MILLGGLYVAFLKKNGVNITVEDIDVITLLPKTPSLHQDIQEILKFVAEDYTAAGKGVEVFDNFKGELFTQSIVLGLVTGDLQGVPDILGKKHPTADQVGYLFPLFRSRSIEKFTPDLIGMWHLSEGPLRVGEI